MVIYKLTNLINDKVYIGQTKNFKQRMNCHKSSCNSKRCKNKPLYIDIKKYGWDNFSKEILFESSNQKIINEKEKLFIKEYKSLYTENGYNIQSGGKYNLHQTDRTKKLISEAEKGNKNHMYGKTGSKNPTSRKVICLNDNKIFNSIKECAEFYNIQSIYKITAVCKGRRASTNNLQFRYLDENLKIIPTIYKTKMKTKKVLNIETNEIFNTCKEAEMKYSPTGKCGNSNIGKVCKGERKTAYGYHWKFIQ